MAITGQNRVDFLRSHQKTREHAESDGIRHRQSGLTTAETGPQTDEQ